MSDKKMPEPSEHEVNAYVARCLKRAQKVLANTGVSNPEPETVARVADMLRQQDSRERTLRLAIGVLQKVNDALDAWLGKGKPRAGT